MYTNQHMHKEHHQPVKYFFPDWWIILWWTYPSFCVGDQLATHMSLMCTNSSHTKINCRNFHRWTQSLEKQCGDLCWPLAGSVIVVSWRVGWCQPWCEMEFLRNGSSTFSLLVCAAASAVGQCSSVGSLLLGVSEDCMGSCVSFSPGALMVLECSVVSRLL